MNRNLSRVTRGGCTGAALLFFATACSFSVGGFDYDKLEQDIADKLSPTYAKYDQSISSVECTELNENPKAGDVVNCTADVADTKVRVEASVKEDDTFFYTTRDTLFEKNETEQILSDLATEQYGFDIAVTCDQGQFFAVEVGKTFECEATDPEGTTRTAVTTVNDDGQITLEIIE